MNLKQHIHQMGIAIDQLLNTFPFMGYADETISARCFRNKHKRYWGIMYEIVNRIFFWQENHCLEAFEKEIERRHLPREYRNAVER